LYVRPREKHKGLKIKYSALLYRLLAYVYVYICYRILASKLWLVWFIASLLEPAWIAQLIYWQGKC
jgi:hypothetical protein